MPNSSVSAAKPSRYWLNRLTKRDPLVTEYRHRSNEAYLAGNAEEARYWARRMKERWAQYLSEHPEAAAIVAEEAVTDEARRRSLAQSAESAKGQGR